MFIRIGKRQAEGLLISGIHANQRFHKGCIRKQSLVIEQDVHAFFVKEPIACLFLSGIGVDIGVSVRLGVRFGIGRGEAAATTEHNHIACLRGTFDRFD